MNLEKTEILLNKKLNERDFDSYEVLVYAGGEKEYLHSSNVNKDTYFDIASMGKVLVTSTLILKAIDKNRLALVDTLEKFFDAEWLCMEISVFGGDDSNICLWWSENSSSERQFYMVHRIIPNCLSTIAFPISEKNFSLHSAFIPPFGALRKGDTNGKPMKKAEAGFVSVNITSETLTRVVINRIFFSNTRPEGNINGQPIIDFFGQRISGEWKNKTKNEQELVEYLKSELASSQSAKYPDGWSAFGGWTALKREATGFFRREKIDGKWWLIDPEGYAFFSNGICYSFRAGVFGFTEEYRSIHEYLPDKDGEFAEAWSTAANIPQYLVRNGSVGAENKEMFSFGRSNLIRAFGKEWYSAYTKITAARMRRLGFNTVCVGTNDYFDERTDYFLKESKIPYVITFRNFPLTKERIFRDFPDVFSKEYEELCREFAESSLKKYADDPYMIGYFVTNEPEWLFSDGVNFLVFIISVYLNQMIERCMFFLIFCWCHFEFSFKNSSEIHWVIKTHYCRRVGY